MSCYTVRICITLTVRKRISTMYRKDKLMKMVNAEEISQTMGVSKATAYKIIRQLNAEMQAAGCRTVQGRVSREYFEKKYFSMPCETTGRDAQ